jgi:hypothetical protein
MEEWIIGIMGGNCISRNKALRFKLRHRYLPRDLSIQKKSSLLPLNRPLFLNIHVFGDLIPKSQAWLSTEYIGQMV